jgi:hypothetical protein
VPFIDFLYALENITYFGSIVGVYRSLTVEPTTEQLKAFYTRCVSASNMFLTINVVRMDERTNRIYVLMGNDVQIEIYPNGKVTFL